MQTQKGGRPTILPKMYEEPLFSQIIDKIESGCNDREIYTSLHCSAKTFRKWRDDNIKAYDEAKSIARGNLLELAESALASKLTVRTLKETETIYDADGNVEIFFYSQSDQAFSNFTDFFCFCFCSNDFSVV